MLDRLKKNEILQLAIPSTIENLLQTAVGFIDSLMIAKIGLVAVSAVGVVNGLMAIFQAIFIALGISATSLIARSFGSKRINEAREATFYSLILSVLVGFFLGLLVFFFGRNLLMLSGAKGEVFHYSWPFFLLVGGCCVFWSILTVEGAIIRATGDTKTPMKIALYVNILNICFNYLLLFVFHFGIIGAGIGTVFARVVGSFLLFQVIQKSRVTMHFPKKWGATSFQKILVLSIPNAIERFMMRFGDVLINVFILQMGTVVFASFTILESMTSFAYMPVFGVSTAVATLVGKNVGANKIRKAMQIKRSSNFIALLLLFATCLLLLIFGNVVAGFFTKDTHALYEIKQSLPTLAFSLCILAFNIIDASALQTIGDTKTPMIATTVGVLFVRLSLVYLLGIHWNLGLNGVWLATGADNLWRSVFLHYRLKQKMASESGRG